MALDGRIPECARPAFFGAALCALRKKDGGLRPIAVGSVYRRLPCRIAARHAADLLAPDFRPVQLGVGTRLGCEAAVHAAREFITRATSNSNPIVFVKVDMCNAFNTVRRDKMLKAIHARCPEIYRLAFQAYSAPTPLHIGNSLIPSSSGVQQGDPLGPIGFSLAIDNCARSMRSPLNIWYLDDATLAGPVSTVTDDLANMQRLLPDLGLKLNSSKCEFTVIGTPPAQIYVSIAGRLEATVPGIRETPLACLTLLGSPLTETGIQLATESAAGTVSSLCDRIRGLDTHTAVFFLAHYISAPRLQYLLRSSPMYINEAGLRAIDETVKSALADVCSVSLDNAAWTQATLPARYGGLGVRSVHRLALPCHISSLAAATPLIASIIPFTLDNSVPSALQLAIERFGIITTSTTVPDADLACKQRTWDDIASEAYRDQLLTEADQTHRARLLAASQPHTASWLQALPVPNLGLLLDPETVRIAVALRLGAPICEPHTCRLCGRQVGRLGHHGLSCQKSAGRFPRHAHLNDLVKRSLSVAGVPSLLEPVGLDRGDGKRPDGLTTFPFASGKCLAWDSTCTDTFSESAVVACALDPGSAARAAEKRKIQRYSSLAEQYLFVPLAVETSGVVGPAASRFFKVLGRRMSQSTGDRRETAWLWQRISIAIIRGNAASIRGSVVLSDTPIKVHYSQSYQMTANGGNFSAQSPPRGASPQAPRNELLIPAKPYVDPGKHLDDPLLIGFPNYGNACYQNATLQSLLGLHPFLRDMMPLISDPARGQCHTLGAVAKLMVLRQKSLRNQIPCHLETLRNTFTDIDPAFSGADMQDAGEFLVRLLNTLQGEMDTCGLAMNPVRTNFLYQTSESLTCTKCHYTMLKNQDNICWFLSPPQRQGTVMPTLQDALQASMQSDRRQRICQHCQHDECVVSSRIILLPRTLILHLKRYIFKKVSRKIHTKVGVPKVLSLSEYMSDETTQLPGCGRTKLFPCALSSSLEGLHCPGGRPSTAPLPLPNNRPPTPPVFSAVPITVAANATSSSASALVLANGFAPAQSPSVAQPHLPTAKAELSSIADASPPLHEVPNSIRSLADKSPGDLDQARRSSRRVNNSTSQCQMVPAGEGTYRLVSVISHRGGTSHSGHYVSDVRSVSRDRWYHYDDSRVTCTAETAQMNEEHQKNGYIFFYLRTDICS